MREDEHAERSCRLDEACGCDRLAGRRRMTEAVTAYGARIGPRVPVFALVVEDVLAGLLHRLVVVLLDRLFDGQSLLIVGLLLSLAGFYAEHLARGALAGYGRFRPYGVALAAEVARTHEELVERAVELAAEIASPPGWAVAAAKAMINRAGDGDQAGNLARELDLFALAFATEDQREGMAAFFEKRAPRFRGR